MIFFPPSSFFFFVFIFVIPIMDFQLWIDELRVSVSFHSFILLYFLYFVWLGVVYLFSSPEMDFFPCDILGLLRPGNKHS